MSDVKGSGIRKLYFNLGGGGTSVGLLATLYLFQALEMMKRTAAGKRLAKGIQSSLRIVFADTNRTNLEAIRLVLKSRHHALAEEMTGDFLIGPRAAKGAGGGTNLGLAERAFEESQDGLYDLISQYDVFCQLGSLGKSTALHMQAPIALMAARMKKFTLPIVIRSAFEREVNLAWWELGEGVLKTYREAGMRIVVIDNAAAYPDKVGTERPNEFRQAAYRRINTPAALGLQHFLLVLADGRVVDGNDIGLNLMSGWGRLAICSALVSNGGIEQAAQTCLQNLPYFHFSFPAGGMLECSQGLTVVEEGMFHSYVAEWLGKKKDSYQGPTPLQWSMPAGPKQMTVVFSEQALPNARPMAVDWLRSPAVELQPLPPPADGFTPPSPFEEADLGAEAPGPIPTEPPAPVVASAEPAPPLPPPAGDNPSERENGQPPKRLEPQRVFEGLGPFLAALAVGKNEAATKLAQADKKRLEELNPHIPASDILHEWIYSAKRKAMLELSAAWHALLFRALAEEFIRAGLNGHDSQKAEECLKELHGRAGLPPEQLAAVLAQLSPQQIPASLPTRAKQAVGRAVAVLRR